MFESPVWHNLSWHTLQYQVVVSGAAVSASSLASSHWVMGELHSSSKLLFTYTNFCLEYLSYLAGDCIGMSLVESV